MKNILRFCFLFLLTFYTDCCYSQDQYDTNIHPGDESLIHYLPILKHRRVALVINQASVALNESILDILLGKEINVVKIFVPEHGFRGKEDAGASVGNTIDSATHLPIISLYGSHKKPMPEDLADVDIVVYDLQDVGVRFYTYISTLQYCMEACAENHKRFVVLDRPDPNGFYVDGPVLESENKSFVGMQPIPIVYGMTVGEYAQMLIGERWLPHAEDLELEVIKCTNYDHTKKYKLPVAPSPNLRTMAAVYAYPSLCLFEGTVVSVGRGTSLPFQQYGCPEFEGKFRYSFTPQSNEGSKNPPYKNQLCYGEVVGQSARDVLQNTNSSICIHWLIKAWEAYPGKNNFFNNFFIKLAGSSRLQTQIQSGTTEAQIRASWEPGLDTFKSIRKKYLLYAE